MRSTFLRISDIVPPRLRFHNRRMHVAFSANRGSVAEPLCNILDGLNDVSLSLRLKRLEFLLPDQLSREDSNGCMNCRRDVDFMKLAGLTPV